MKYSPFDGSLDRVIEDLLEQNKTLKAQLELATQELARMDDRVGASKPVADEEEDPFVEVQIGPLVRRVGYENGELSYDVQTLKFKLRESVVRTVAQVEDEHFEIVDSE